MDDAADLESITMMVYLVVTAGCVCGVGDNGIPMG